MLYKIIRQERLTQYRNRVRQLNFLRSKKFEVLNSCGLKAYDYSKIKVMTGNGRKLTEQERAVLSVEKFDTKIKELQALISVDTKELEQQIERVDKTSDNWKHAEALRSYYLEGETKQETAFRVYGGATKQDVKNLSELLKTALEILEKVSGKPFVEVQQLVLEDWGNEART